MPRIKNLAANALVPPTPIWRAMVIRCYPMLSYMFPYLSCLSMIFTRILGDLKVETEDCSPGGLESCRDRRTVDMRPLAWEISKPHCPQQPLNVSKLKDAQLPWAILAYPISSSLCRLICGKIIEHMHHFDDGKQPVRITDCRAVLSTTAQNVPHSSFEAQ